MSEEIEEQSQFESLDMAIYALMKQIEEVDKKLDNIIFPNDIGSPEAIVCRVEQHRLMRLRGQYERSIDFLKKHFAH